MLHATETAELQNQRGITHALQEAKDGVQEAHPKEEVKGKEGVISPNGRHQHKFLHLCLCRSCNKVFSTLCNTWSYSDNFQKLSNITCKGRHAHACTQQRSQ